MSKRMEGKTVLITGTGGGIGLAIAHSLVREGAAVARTEQAASDFRDQGAKAYGVGASSAGHCYYKRPCRRCML